MIGEIVFFSKRKGNGAIEYNKQLYYFNKADYEEGIEFKEKDQVEFDGRKSVTQENTNRVFFATNIRRVE